MSPLPPRKIWGDVFHEKALHYGTNFSGQIFEGIIYIGTNDQIMQEGKLMVMRFQRSSQVIFSFH